MKKAAFTYLLLWAAALVVVQPTSSQTLDDLMNQVDVGEHTT